MNEVTELIEQIDFLYPGRFQLEDPIKTIRAWHKVLQDEDSERVNQNLVRHSKSSHYIPTISDLVKVAEERCRTVPNSEETQAYLKKLDERAMKKRDESGIKAAQEEIRKMLKVPEGEKSDGND